MCELVCFESMLLQTFLLLVRMLLFPLFDIFFVVVVVVDGPFVLVLVVVVVVFDFLVFVLAAVVTDVLAVHYDI